MTSTLTRGAEAKRGDLPDKRASVFVRIEPEKLLTIPNNRLPDGRGSVGSRES